MQHVVVNFGSPRSGTTWMERCLLELKAPIFTFKLAEGRILHPCQSKDGLLELAMILRHKHLTIIRTVRDPLEIAESFIAMRKLAKHGALRKFTDAKAVEFITTESKNVAAQRGELKSSPEWKHEGRQFFEVHYERMAEEGYRADFARRLTAALPDSEENHQRMLKAFDGYGKHPVRPGRLASGLGRMTTVKERAWFRVQLAAVIEREGYNNAA